VLRSECRPVPPFTGVLRGNCSTTAVRTVVRTAVLRITQHQASGDLSSALVGLPRVDILRRILYQLCWARINLTVPNRNSGLFGMSRQSPFGFIASGALGRQGPLRDGRVRLGCYMSCYTGRVDAAFGDGALTPSAKRRAGSRRRDCLLTCYGGFVECESTIARLV
jgi:hypothetical protein